MKKFIKKVLTLLLVLGVSLSGVIFYLGYREYRDVTENVSIQKQVLEVTQKDDYASLEMIPQIFMDAVVSVEDERYWKRNSTLDFEALLRATYHNIRNLSLVEGASTIPQQVSKNLYFSHSASFKRKVAEYFITRDLLKVYSKEEILELYVNMIYYGAGAYGVQSAALNYFNMNVWELNDGELVILAGLPQAPSVYDLNVNYDLAKQRQSHVLDRMVKTGVLKEAEAEVIYDMEVRHEEAND